MNPKTSYQVLGWTYKPGAASLTGHGEVRRLTPRLNKLLLALVTAEEQTLSKDELVRAVWDREAISDDAIARAVSDLRKALRNREVEEPIRSVHGFGYRLQATPAPARPRRHLPAVIAVIVLVAAGLYLVLPRQNRVEPLETQAVTPMTAYPRLDARNRYLPVADRLVYFTPGGAGASLVVEEQGKARTLVAGRSFGPAAPSPDGLAVAYIDLTEGCEIRAVSVDGGPGEKLGNCMARASHAINWTEHGNVLAGQLSDDMMTVYEFDGSALHVDTFPARDCKRLGHVARTANGQTYVSCRVEASDALYEIVDGTPIRLLEYRSITRFAIDADGRFYFLHGPRWKAGITRLAPPQRTAAGTAGRDFLEAGEFEFLQSGWVVDFALHHRELTLVRNLTNPDLLGYSLDDGSPITIEEGGIYTVAYTVDAEGSLWQIDDRAGPLALYRNDQPVPSVKQPLLEFSLADVICMTVDASSRAIRLVSRDPGAALDAAARAAVHDLQSGALLESGLVERGEACPQTPLPEDLATSDPRLADASARSVQLDLPRNRVYYIVDRTPYLDIATMEINPSD